MPPIEGQGRHQEAVLWMANGVDDYGNALVDQPVGILVRWETTESKPNSANTNNESVIANVVVDREISNGSIMWLGSMAELPVAPTDLCIVVSYQKVPDIKGRNVQQSVTLARFRDTLPTVNG